MVLFCVALVFSCAEWSGVNLQGLALCGCGVSCAELSGVTAGFGVVWLWLWRVFRVVRFDCWVWRFVAVVVACV
mgnify:CR=1 FL=1